MNKRSKIIEYLRLVLHQTGFLIKGKGSRLTPSDARRALFLFKVFDIIWFENNLPSNYEEKFPVVFHVEWEWRDQVSDILEIVDLNEQSLKYISDRLRTPLWITSGQGFMMCIEDILSANE